MYRSRNFTTSKTFEIAGTVYRVEADIYFGSTLPGGPDPDEVSDIRVRRDRDDLEVDYDEFVALWADSEDIETIDDAEGKLAIIMFEHGDEESREPTDRY